MMSSLDEANVLHTDGYVNVRAWMLARQPESCGYVALEGPFKFMFQTF